jgi:hypothetical protein
MGVFLLLGSGGSGGSKKSEEFSLRAPKMLEPGDYYGLEAETEAWIYNFETGEVEFISPEGVDSIDCLFTGEKTTFMNEAVIPIDQYSGIGDELVGPGAGDVKQSTHYYLLDGEYFGLFIDQRNEFIAAPDSSNRDSMPSTASIGDTGEYRTDSSDYFIEQLEIQPTFDVISESTWVLEADKANSEQAVLKIFTTSWVKADNTFLGDRESFRTITKDGTLISEIINHYSETGELITRSTRVPSDQCVPL